MRTIGNQLCIRNGTTFHLDNNGRSSTRVVALRTTINPETSKKHTETEAARSCEITITAAQRAAALQRNMDQLGL